MSIFFLIVFLSFFLPTNIEGIPEIYWAGALSVLLIVHAKNILRSNSINRSVQNLWGITGVMLLLGLFHTRSAAATLLTIIRYTEGFAIFLLGASWALKRKRLIHLFTIYGSIASCVFLILVPVTPYTSILPSYNSIVAINGHHPFASFLLLFLPFIFFSKRAHIVSKIQLYIPIIGLILSAARNAWGIMILFMFTQINTMYVRKTSGILLGIFFITFTSTLWLSTLPDTQKTALTHRFPLVRSYLKELNMDHRIEFTHQALKAISTSPFIGHGPGTFSLLSKQYESGPGAFATYAHSFLMETLAENGLVGSIPIIALFLYAAIHSLQGLKQKTLPKELSWAILLTLLYGAIDVHLNILPIWILFWLLVGISQDRSTKNIKVHNLLAYIPAITLGVFALTGVISYMYSTSGNTYAAIQIAPYRKSLVLSASERELRLLKPYLGRWYTKDPDVRMSTPPYVWQVALTYDPYSMEYLRKELIEALQTHNEDVLQSFLCNPHRFSPTPMACPENIHTITTMLLLHKQESLMALSHLEGNDGLSKALYFLGLSIYNTSHDADAAIYLLRLARDNAPTWGYYHVALSSAQYYWAHDIQSAIHTLMACKTNPEASVGCKYTHPDQLYIPDAYKHDISRIPEIQ